MATKAKKTKPAAKKVVAKKKAAAKQAAPKKGFQPTKLKLLRPVPSDIEIAQAGKLKPITQVAEELGLQHNLTGRTWWRRRLF